MRLTSSFLTLAVFLPMLAGAGMTKPDRERLIAHLEMTEAWVLVELANLTPAQLAFQPSPTAWSIHNVLEHLAVAEPQYWQQIQDSLKKGPTAYQSKVKDADILWYGIDRTRRAKTGAAREPKGQFEKTAKALESFRQLRATMLATARSSQDDFRAIQLTDSTMDLYQWFLMISSHSQRHLLQIREIKANPAFPKS